MGSRLWLGWTMSTPVENVMQAIRQASDLYHRLVLLAGPQGTGKTAILQALANAD